MTANNPNYQIFTIDLSNAGQQDINARFTYLRMVKATVGSSISLDAIVSVVPRRTGGDAIPVQLNGLIKLPAGTDFLRVSWDAQPGVTVELLISDQDNTQGIEVEAPPTKQIVTSSIGAGFTTAQVALGAAATQLTPADAARQSVTIKAFVANTDTVYIGPDNTLDGTKGVPLSPGESITIDKNTGAVYGYGSATNPKVAVMVEK